MSIVEISKIYIIMDFIVNLMFYTGSFIVFSSIFIVILSIVNSRNR